MNPIEQLLNQPLFFVDGDGYEHQMMEVASHPANGWRAWAEERRKWIDRVMPGEATPRRWLDNEFRLRAVIEGELAIDWQIVTYNPAFGCSVQYLAWDGERVVGIYREKHDTYVCSLATRAEVRLQCIGFEWAVNGGVLGFCKDGSDLVKRLALPSLEEAQAVGPEPQEH